MGPGGAGADPDGPGAASPASVVRLAPGHAAGYRALMLGAYARHPDAFTSSAEERAALPLDGLGRRLVGTALDVARARPGVRVLALTVTDGNDAARRLYESLGFVRFGGEPMAVRVGDGFVAEVHLWRAL